MSWFGSEQRDRAILPFLSSHFNKSLYRSFLATEVPALWNKYLHGLGIPADVLIADTVAG